MFVRKKKNRSGSTSIVVVKKISGKTKYIKTIGISSNDLEIEDLYRQGEEYILSLSGQKDIFGNYEAQLKEEDLTPVFRKRHPFKNDYQLWSISFVGYHCFLV